MVEATSATATFLFTDIEGSTQLLRSHRDVYAEILADHHRLLRTAFAAHGGREVDNQGDAFFVAFARAKDAVLAAAGAQRALAAHSWPDGAALRVRMGIHTGEAELTVDRYVGMSVHRAARICALGHGGQALVSQTTAGLLDDDDDLPGLALTDLGEHKLKDISRPVRLYQLDIEGLRGTFPPLGVGEPPEPSRRKRVVLATAALLVAGAAAIALALLTRDEAPPAVVANSLVRIDPSTLKPTDVVPVGDAPDLVVAAGGFVWITHFVLRDVNSGELRNAGDRTLTRVDPSTGDVVVVGGGLAPCGLTSDPSGDVWVANCYQAGSGRSGNVVRIDASSLRFEATWPVRTGYGFYRGLAYGGGSLWVSGEFGTSGEPSLTEVDPETGAQHPVRVTEQAAGLAWSEGYGDLWLSDFYAGSVSRLHASTQHMQTVGEVATNPGAVAVDRDTVWVGDWSSEQVTRLNAVRSSRPRTIILSKSNTAPGVWSVAAGAGAIWATTPRDHSLWRIDPETNRVTRIQMPHLPTGVAADADAVWVTVRAA
jgi:class 3 adenylate cyclase/streptogramin lyase